MSARAPGPRKSGALRRVLLKVHLFIGLVLGVPILILALTGCFMMVHPPIDRWRNAHLFQVEPKGERLALEELVARVRAAYPRESPLEIRVPPEPDRSAVVSLRSRRLPDGPLEPRTVLVDPYTGDVKRDRWVLAPWTVKVGQLHTGRIAGPAGRTVAASVTAVAFFAVLSGIYLWWPRKIVSLKRSANWRRTNFDLHNVFGIFSSVVLLFVTLSGVLIGWETALEPLLVRWIDGKEMASPPRLESTVVESGRRITLDEAEAIATRALPGTFTVGVNVPPPGKAVFQVLKRFPEDATGGGRSRVFVDQYSGAVLRVVNSREEPLGTQIMNFSEPVHMGHVFGWPGMTLAFLATAALATQVVTGFLIWRKPRRKAAPEELDGAAAGPAVVA